MIRRYNAKSKIINLYIFNCNCEIKEKANPIFETIQFHPAMKVSLESFLQLTFFIIPGLDKTKPKVRGDVGSIAPLLRKLSPPRGSSQTRGTGNSLDHEGNSIVSLPGVGREETRFDSFTDQLPRIW